MAYPYQVLSNWAIALLTLGILATCELRPAHASDWSLDMKGGLAVPFRTTPDGTFIQEAFEHKTRSLTKTFAVGLDYRMTPAWSIQAHYLDLGASQIKGFAVSDSSYDYKHHRCMQGCATPYYFKASDTLRGGDLTVTYTWQRETIKPFVKGGVAILHHHATFDSINGAPDNFTGLVPEIEVGAGVSAGWAYLELDYFQGMNFGGQNLPISTQQVVTFAGVKIPLS